MLRKISGKISSNPKSQATRIWQTTSKIEKCQTPTIWPLNHSGGWKLWCWILDIYFSTRSFKRWWETNPNGFASQGSVWWDICRISFHSFVLSDLFEHFYVEFCEFLNVFDMYLRSFEHDPSNQHGRWQSIASSKWRLIVRNARRAAIEGVACPSHLQGRATLITTHTNFSVLYTLKRIGVYRIATIGSDFIHVGPDIGMDQELKLTMK